MRCVTKIDPVGNAGLSPKEPLPGTAPVKDSNPPEADVKAPDEVPKVGSRDAPGG